MRNRLRLITTKFKKWSEEKFDVKAIRSSFHIWLLLGISLYVFVQMEEQLTKLKKLSKYSMSEREFEQQEAYKTMIEQLNMYDGEGVPLERSIEEGISYKYDMAEDD